MRHVHETTDISIRNVAIFTLVFLAVMFVIHLVAAAFYGGFRRANPSAPYASAFGRKNQEPPEPRLQANPSTDLEQFRRSEEAILDSYGWADKANGFARVPIERAMRMLVEESRNKSRKSQVTSEKSAENVKSPMSS